MHDRTHHEWVSVLATNGPARERALKELRQSIFPLYNGFC